MSKYLKNLIFLAVLGMGWAGSAFATPLEEPNFCLNPIGNTPWICQAVACGNGEHTGKDYFLGYKFKDAFIERIVFTTESELPYLTVEKRGVKLFVPICQSQDYYEGIMTTIGILKGTYTLSDGTIQLPSQGTKIDAVTSSTVAAAFHALSP